MSGDEPTLESLMRDGIRILGQIHRLEEETAEWNKRHPDRMPIDWDPDGEMVRIRVAVSATVEDIRRRINVERLIAASRGKGE